MYTLTLNPEVPFEITYFARKGYAQTYDDPGESDEIEILSVSLYEILLTPVQMERFISDYGRAELDAACFEDLENNLRYNF